MKQTENLQEDLVDHLSKKMKRGRELERCNKALPHLLKGSGAKVLYQSGCATRAWNFCNQGQLLWEQQGHHNHVFAKEHACITERERKHEGVLVDRF